MEMDAHSMAHESVAKCTHVFMMMSFDLSPGHSIAMVMEFPSKSFHKKPIQISKYLAKKQDHT